MLQETIIGGKSDANHEDMVRMIISKDSDKSILQGWAAGGGLPCQRDELDLVEGIMIGSHSYTAGEHRKISVVQSMGQR